jgi:hypothetical protein
MIDKEARIILKRWTRCQYYVYLRPLDYRFYNPTADFAVHWKVTVEYRGLGYKQHVGEGMNLSEVIKKLGLEVPLNKPKLSPRASVPRPTTVAKINVNIRKNPGRVKLTQKFVDDARGDAEAMPANGGVRKRKKKPHARRK